MSRIARVFTSSIGKKYVMGITGLLLIGFLVGHLGGNFLLFLGPEWINAYATNLHATGPLLLLIETGLAAIFVIHIWMAYSLTRDYQKSRPAAYAAKETKQERSVWWAAPSTWMIISGTIALAFLVLHMIDMRFGLRTTLDPFFAGYPEAHGWHNEPTAEFPVVDIYSRTVAVLQTPLSAILYVVGVIFIGFHLSHGFQSSFRSLGIAHPVYSKALSWLGNVFAVAITAGFAIIPIWVWAFDIQPEPVYADHIEAAEEEAAKTAEVDSELKVLPVSRAEDQNRDASQSHGGS